MAWVYGADKFLEDLRYMLGFYPYPYYFWYWAWKIVSPAIVLVSSSTPSRVHFTHCGAPLYQKYGIFLCHLQSILLFTALDYSGNTYSDYEYPTWANIGGWMITFSSVILIPIVAIKKICQEEGSLKEVRERQRFNDIALIVIFQRVLRLVQPTSDWGPEDGDHREYVKPKSQHQLQDQRYVQDIIRHQNDLCYVDVDIGRAGDLTATGVRGIETTRRGL